MAGDWLKIEANTPDKPEVIGIADMLGISPPHAFGCLFMVWRWFDQHTTSGNASFVTKVTVDRLSGVTGFADAMARVGWLDIAGDGTISLPNFGRHNGETAKQRGLTAKRVANHKSKGNEGSNASSVSEVTDDALPREEKRREEVNLKPHSEERGEVNGTTAAQNPPPPPSRKGIVCGLLRKAGMADAAPHYLPDDAWETILAKRTDEEIIEVALAKMAAKPNGRIGLKYIAQALLADPEPITPSARGSPKSTWGKHADYLRQQGYIGDGNGNGNAGGTIDGEAKRVA